LTIKCLPNKTQDNPCYQKNDYAANSGGKEGALSKITRNTHKTVINPCGSANGKQKSYQPFAHKLIITKLADVFKNLN
jgi:hypothetical protein